MSEPSPSPETLLADAMEITNAAERRAYLDRACGGDAALRAEVESLLAANAAAGEFLLRPAHIGASAAQKTMLLPPLSEVTGTRIGRYKLLEQIGEGGFGVVWMAEQEEPVRRRVALKIIKLGMDTKEVLARFEAERQALAMMEHPNIASVFDGGATDTGRPYFVMELVKGIPITDYCDAAKLSTRERLDLFMQVCQAVQHAHQKGIIHRDLKPSNILVTVRDDRAVPKVIDFGIAKATQARLTEKTIFTRLNQWIGTPAYMSPEQAGLGSMDVDTRSDIYSLGVLLYELLTSRTPFDTQKLLAAGHDAVMRTIREEEPPKPSTRLSTLGEVELNTVAAKRGAEPAKLNRLVRGDLDWIVMKALEKDRRRRYETADALARDLQRHLEQEPVMAAAPGGLYLLQKFVRRHQRALAVTAALVIMLAAGALVSTLEAVRAVRAEREQITLRQAAETARNAEAVERQKATSAAQESRARLVRLNAANGARFLEQGDYAGALTWFAEAFRLDTSGTVQDQIHRRRLGALLRQSPRPVEMWFHKDQITSASFDAGGRRVLTASEDGTVRVVSMPSATVVSPASTHSGPVRHAAFNADGTLAASAGSDGVRVWRSDSGAVVHRLTHPGAFFVEFGADGQPLVSAGGCEVRVWDALTGVELMPPVVHAARVSSFALSPNGRLLATGTYGGRGEVWDLTVPKRVFELRVGDSVRSLAFNPAGDRVAAADWANGVFLWRVDTGELVLPPLTHDALVAHVTFSHDGRWLASSSLDLTTKLWQTDSGALLRVFLHPGYPMESVFDAEDRWLLTRRFDGWIHFWNARTGRQARAPIRHTSWVTALALHPDGRLILTGSADGSVRVLDLQPDGALVSPWPGQNQRIAGSAVNGAWVVTQDPQLRLAVWDSETWRSRAEVTCASGPVLAAFVDASARRLLFVESASRSAPVPGSGERAVLFDLENNRIVAETALGSEGNASAVTSTAASLDCAHLGLARGKKFELWDCARGQRLGKPSQHATEVKTIRFSPDGTRVLVNCGRTLHVLDAATGRDAMAPLTNNLATGPAAFSPDGKLIASGGTDVSYQPGEARIWDATTGTLLTTIRHSDGVNAVAFSPDGRWLATGSEDQSARAWDVRTGQPVTPRLPHSATVEGLAFNSDGGLLASVTGQGDVLVWDTSNGEPVTPPLGQGKGAKQVCFLAGSQCLLTDAREGWRLWRVEPSELPTEDLVNLAQLFAGHRVDATGALEPLPLEHQAALHAALRMQHPEAFRLETRSPERLVGPPANTPQRDPDATRDQIDMTQFYTARLGGSWLSGTPNNGLDNLPAPLPLLNGVRFDVRGIVQLSGQSGANLGGRAYPEQVRGIQVGFKCRRLHFLHAAGWSVADGIEVGCYVIHYTNGRSQRIPLLYGEDLRDWWVAGEDARPVPRANIAWDGVTPAGNRVAIYHRAWTNPTPDVPIKSVDFVSSLTACAPFLIAITAEP